MPLRPSITYWQRVEPSPRSDSLAPGLAAAVRDPLWFLTRQWQLGEFQGEDAASPAWTTLTLRSSTLDSWTSGPGDPRPLDGGAPLEAVVEAEPATPDRRTAVELGQALERRVAAAVPAHATTIVDALRGAFPVPTLDQLSVGDRRDPALVRLARVCGGRATDGLAALTAARAAAPGIPAGVPVPGGTFTAVSAALAAFVAWVDATLGPIGLTDPATWRPDRLEYAVDLAARTPGGVPIQLAAHAGTHGEFDWYSFDETARARDSADPPATAGTASLLPAPVRFAGMPDPRWWNFEDARVNWAAVDTDRRDLARLLVVDFMLVQGNDWFTVPCGHPVGGLLRVDQLLVRDVFGEWTRLEPANVPAAPPGRQRWAMFATTGAVGLADYTVLPPSALRTTLDGPDLEEVRFVRDEQANLVWGVETFTQDGAGRPRRGADRDATVAAPTPPPASGLRYRLQTTVPVHWIPFVPVQVDDTRRAVALERAAMQREIDGALVAVAPAGRVLRPTGLADPDVYRIPEEEVGRSGTRVLRAAHRTRWVDGSTHLWTARRRRAGLGEAASGLRYDVVDRPD